LPERSSRGAVFLDRDGTIIRDPGFLHDPAGVAVVPGAAQAIARLNQAGLLVVIVSNQSGIARGLYPESDYHRVQARTVELVAAAGGRIDASFFCPHHPDVTGPCDCRKPGVLLFERAARELGIDLARSFWIGDRPSDVAPARRLGGKAYLVLTGQGESHVAAARTLGVPVVADLAAAVTQILAATAR
jgi:D-glycero-D-manno-heptose 1,7-bisphosphate phosphatase